ncbi:RiPP maturation radical SAM C-methyltransferase [Rhodoblastus sp.]|uniref:RiPP maturation radical SAM C-methyltransferase n=1 Tax=Rhodoblastus sp. TaxID=1962975 RepID=UPI0035B31A83
MLDLQTHPAGDLHAPEIMTGAQACRVALVNMPFVSIYRPSLQLGLLRAIAEREGFRATTFHLNLDFAQQIGPKLYEQLVHHRGRMFGDWLFSPAAFAAEAPDPGGDLLDKFGEEAALLLADLGVDRNALLDIRNRAVPLYLDRMLDSVDWSAFQVIGFTSTFQQNIAAFALAARLKQRFPHLITLFGGANFEGEMGLALVESVDCIDYAVIGEGDEAFPAFLRAVAEGDDPALTPGVVSRATARKTQAPRAPFRRLDELPLPDYEEFFARAENVGLIPDMSRRLVYLPFESSRGCWWGQKHHCTFCGLNGGSMAYRSKSPALLRDQLAELVKRYRSFMLEAVDNIADHDYFASFFPAIVADKSDYQFFYEVKSNLTRDKIHLLRDAGVKRIQPGVESLNSHVLKLMRKGVSAAQNINLLRWALYYGVDVGWNIIWGFPGETEDDYRDQLSIMKQIVHLQPPTGAGRIWMERFSPLFTERRTFPARFVRPETSYSYVYPSGVELDRVAYFFEYELDGALADETYVDTRDWVRAWQAAWKQERRPTLHYWSAPNFIQIDDLREVETSGTYTFKGALADIYVCCSDRPMTAASVKETLHLGESVDEIAEALHEFASRGLMFHEGGHFLSLAIPATPGR